jgi:uncharacterized membrane protein
VQFLIILPIFAGILLMALESFSPRKIFKSLEKGVLLGVAAAIGMAFVNFFTASGSKTVSPLMAIWVPWVVFTVMCAILLKKRGELGTLFAKAGRFKMLVISMGIADTAAWLFYAVAVSINEISITTAITESYPAIALVLGLLLNKERIRIHQGLGAVLAIIASFALAATI